MAKSELAIQGKLIDVSLKDDVTAAQAFHVVDSICGALQRAETSVEAARFALGRVLVDVRDRNLYSPQYPSFEQYTMALVEKYRLSRATLRNTMKHAERLGEHLTPKQVESVPGYSLELIARAAPNVEARVIPRLLKEAQGRSTMAFREFMIEKNYIGRPGRPNDSERKLVTVKIVKVPRSVAGKWSVLVGERSAAALFSEIVNELVATRQKAA